LAESQDSDKQDAIKNNHEMKNTIAEIEMHALEEKGVRYLPKVKQEDKVTKQEIKKRNTRLYIMRFSNLIRHF
jgi:hypothetical protein